VVPTESPRSPQSGAHGHAAGTFSRLSVYRTAVPLAAETRRTYRFGREALTILVKVGV
jgi:hypothetical protein